MNGNLLTAKELILLGARQRLQPSDPLQVTMQPPRGLFEVSCCATVKVGHGVTKVIFLAPTGRSQIRQLLRSWVNDELERHRTFVFTILTAVHEDGSHTAEGQRNHLTSFSGESNLRMHLGEYLGVRVGTELAGLMNATKDWRSVDLAVYHLMSRCNSESRSFRML